LPFRRVCQDVNTLNTEDISTLAAPLREQRALFERHIEPLRPDLWRYCYRLTGSEWSAEDLVQDTLVRAFGRLAHHWQPVAPRAYLFRIATNIWIDRMSSSGKLEPWTEAIEAVDSAEPWERLEAREALEAAASTLPPRQRAALLLTGVFGFSPAEVAAMIGAASPGSVKALLHRARQNMREAGERPAEASCDVEAGPLLRGLVDAFNRADLDAFARLLSEDARVDIVGVAEEIGREHARRSSLKSTFEDPDAAFAETAVVDEEAMILLCHREGGETVLSEIVRLEERAGEAATLRSYYFCPELLETVGAKLGMRVKTHGYRFEFGGSEATT
jgi:RNA polymerase sigma factor (sigma-70 family)